MQGNERWRPLTGNSNPSARLKAARSMPQWLHARGSALPPPPPPPEEPPPDPDYEVIEFPGQTYSNTPLQHEVKSRSENKRCDLCGSTAPAVQCAQCSQQNFCPSCDDMYHRHPKRQSHVRKALTDHHHQHVPNHHQQGFRPPLPPKGEPAVAPVPPPRRNRRMPPPSPHLHHHHHHPPISRPITPQNFDQVVGPAKKDVGIVGSLKRMITGRPLPAPPMARQMDRFRGMPPQSQPGFQEPRGMGRDFGYPEWELERGQRSGSMTALNMVPPFSPMMQAHSMAQLNCPSCQHHGMMWGDWNTGQVWGGPGGGMHVHGGWQSSGMIPPYRQEDGDVIGRRNSLRPQRYRPRGVSSSDEEDETMSRRRSDLDDSDEEERLHQQHPKRIPRRGSLMEGLNRARRLDEDNLSVRGSVAGKRFQHETLTSRSTRRNEETASNRGGRRRDPEEVRTMPRLDDRRFDDEVMSNRGGRKSDMDETMSVRSSRRGSTRRAEEVVSKRRRDIEESRTMSRIDDRRFDDEVVSNRGGRRNDLDETMSLRSSRRDTAKKKYERFLDTGRRRRSPVDVRRNSPPESPERSTPLPVNGATSSEAVSAQEPEEKEEEEELEPLAQTPTGEWECQHCTFVNQPGIRVCAVCCKTITRPKIQSIGQELKTTDAHQKQANHQPIDVEVEESFKKMGIKEAPSPAKASTGDSFRPLKKKGAGLTEESGAGQLHKSVTSKGTSPPPQTISTQTYEVLGRKLKRTASLADHEWNQAPLRSHSRQSLLSDTQSLPVTPPRGRSPELDNLSQAAESQTESLAHSLSSRRISEPATLSRNSRRAGSQPPDYISTLVQKQVKQGLEMVKLLRDAEEHQFTAEDLGVALSHCGDGDPVGWLIDNWRNMIDTVVTLATNYGHERKENTVGTISAAEAREALRQHNGNVWSAVTECVDQRQKKYGELLSRGNFTREDIVTALTANHGNLEAAYVELSKSQLKPFLMRIWGPPQGADNEGAPPPPQANNRPDEEEDVVVAEVMGGGAAGRGSGGDKRDEVSLDKRQIITNNNMSDPSGNSEARVRSWLTSQEGSSSPQPTRGVMTPRQRRELRMKRDRRYSDVQRYLADYYLANSRSLKINDQNRYSSVQNLAQDKGGLEGRYKSCNDLAFEDIRRDHDEEAPAMKFILQVPLRGPEPVKLEQEDIEVPLSPSPSLSDKAEAKEEVKLESPQREIETPGDENENVTDTSQNGEPAISTEIRSNLTNKEISDNEDAEINTDSTDSSQDTSSSESFESVSSSEEEDDEDSCSDEDDVTRTIVNKEDIPKFYSAVNLGENIPFADEEPAAQETLIGPPSEFNDSEPETTTSEEEPSNHRHDSEFMAVDESVNDFPETSDILEEDNSDRDVSSIPLDPPTSDGGNSAELDPLKKRKLEILDLLKQSLTKDSVIDRIVTTLFATMVGESTSLVQSPSVVSTSSEQEPEFYEAKEVPENLVEAKQLEESNASAKVKIEDKGCEILENVPDQSKLVHKSPISDSENEYGETYKTEEDSRNSVGSEEFESPNVSNNLEITFSEINGSDQRSENGEQTAQMDISSEKSPQETGRAAYVDLLSYQDPPGERESAKAADNSAPTASTNGAESYNVDTYRPDSKESGVLITGVNPPEFGEEYSISISEEGNSIQGDNDGGESEGIQNLKTPENAYSIITNASTTNETTVTSSTEDETTTGPILQQCSTDGGKKLNLGTEPEMSTVFDRSSIMPDEVAILPESNVVAQPAESLADQEHLTDPNSESSITIHGGQDVSVSIGVGETKFQDPSKVSKNNGDTNIIAPTIDNLPYEDSVCFEEAMTPSNVKSLGLEEAVHPDDIISKEKETLSNTGETKHDLKNDTSNHETEKLEGDKIPSATDTLLSTNNDTMKENNIPEGINAASLHDEENGTENIDQLPTSSSDCELMLEDLSVGTVSSENRIAGETHLINEKETRENGEDCSPIDEPESSDLNLLKAAQPELSSIVKVLPEVGRQTVVLDSIEPHESKSEKSDSTEAPVKSLIENNSQTIPTNQSKKESTSSSRTSSSSLQENITNGKDLLAAQKNGSDVRASVSEKESKELAKKTIGYALSRRPAASKLPVLTRTRLNGAAKEPARPKQAAPGKIKKSDTYLGQVVNRFGGGFNKITNAIKSIEGKLEKDNQSKQKTVNGKGPISTVKKETGGEVAKKPTRATPPKINAADEERNEKNPGKTVVVIVDISDQRRKSEAEIESFVGPKSVEDSGVGIISKTGPETLAEESFSQEEESFNFEREVRRCLAEGLVDTYDQAEIAVQLMELKFEKELSLVAAKECPTIQAAITYLQQDCHLCTGKYPMTQMVDMLECEHRCCQECALAYFTLQITERMIDDCVCPYCKKPNLSQSTEDTAINYFSNLDILLKGLLAEKTHELFQRKLRDRTLMQDPNFKWCVKCSSGFIANPMQKRLICPDCKTITCAKCRRPWGKEHEGVSCEEYAVWVQEHNDHENLLAKHLAEHGIVCPQCKNRYALAKGGCMHLTCPQCKHEFCSGCSKEFLMGDRCKVSEFCVKLGLHAHHPRNCLFYLRDKEPQLLQKLLDDNGVAYQRSGEESATTRCLVQLMKETNEGLVDGICGLPVESVGLCRTHLIEHLVKLVKESKVDPATIMDQVEAVQELRRRGKDPPPRDANMKDEEYLTACIKMVQEEIPLE